MNAVLAPVLMAAISASPLVAGEGPRDAALSLAAGIAGDRDRTARSGVAADGEDFGDPQVRVCPDGGYESGCNHEDIAGAMRLEEDLPQNLAASCLFATKADCIPSASGTLLPVGQPSTIIWQLMTIQPVDGPRIEMLAMVETEGVLSNLLASAQTEGWYGTPEVVQDSGEVLMIHAPGRSGGTGMGNVDVLLTRHGMGWTTFDVNALLEEATELLPEGFALAGGVDFDFREMFASAPVKRESDGACCATGGVALIDFAMPQPNLMQVGSLTFEETAPVTTHRIAPDASRGGDQGE